MADEEAERERARKYLEDISLTTAQLAKGSVSNTIGAQVLEMLDNGEPLSRETLMAALRAHADRAKGKDPAAAFPEAAIERIIKGYDKP